MERFSGERVEVVSDGLQFILGDIFEVRTFGDVATNEFDGVLDRSLLPRGVWMTEIGVYVVGLMVLEFNAVVHGEGVSLWYLREDIAYFVCNVFWSSVG